MLTHLRSCRITIDKESPAEFGAFVGVENLAGFQVSFEGWSGGASNNGLTSRACRFADGDYICSAGWPSLTGVHARPFLDQRARQDFDCLHPRAEACLPRKDSREAEGKGTGALAEITISGDAELGIDYTSEPGDMKSKHSFVHEMGVDFSGSGTTDGGLSFGGSAGFDTGDDKVNTGSVFISGGFGKVTIGDNDAADLLAGGIADVGLNGIGVDDVAESIRGRSAKQFRYDQSVGNISLAISAGTADGVLAKENTFEDNNGKTVAGALEVKKNSYAIGMSFSASGATVGLGYDSLKTISAGFGYSTGQIAANAFYTKGEKPYKHLGSNRAEGGTGNQADGMFAAGLTGIGVDVSYTMSASKLTLVYVKSDVDNIQSVWADGDGVPGSEASDKLTFESTSFKGVGVNVSHDLDGGATLVAGFGQVPSKTAGGLGIADIGQQADHSPVDAIVHHRRDLSGDMNKASVGLSFSF